MKNELPIVNLLEARYECTFGRGCDGICCREGLPIVYPEEIERINANLHKFSPLLRPEAQRSLSKRGYLRNRRRLNERVVRISHGWCIFFNQGCVLHRVGADEGDKFRYKPAVCALFPIQRDTEGNWYVRQKGYKEEKWDLFCLDPQSTTAPASRSLSDEVALARRFDKESAGSEPVVSSCHRACRGVYRQPPGADPLMTPPAPGGRVAVAPPAFEP